MRGKVNVEEVFWHGKEKKNKAEKQILTPLEIKKLTEKEN